MAHEPKDFRRLISECQGFLSEKQLQAHFTLYQGYVKKLNEIESSLQQADREKANYSYSEYSELRRREPVWCPSRMGALAAASAAARRRRGRLPAQRGGPRL